MKIQVRLFAILRQYAGVERIELEIDPGLTARAAASLVARQYPQIATHLAKVSLAVNRQIAPGDQLLCDGDELALLPAVSGGV